MNVIILSDISSTFGYGKYAGAYKVASMLRHANYSCQVVDNFTWLSIDKIKQILDKFIDDSTLMLGISTTLLELSRGWTYNEWGKKLEELIDILDYAKSKNPNIKIVMGGGKVNSTSDYPFIDYGIVGKADNAIVALVNHLATGSDLIHSSNLHTKIVKGDDYFYSQCQFSKSMIEYQHNDIILPDEALPLEIARGCIFSCSFCRYDLIGKKIGDWTKQADTIVEEMTKNYELFGTTTYMFSDELINESMPKMEMLVNAIARLPFKIKYSSYARIDLIHKFPDMREMLLESGAEGLTFGIETLNFEAGKKVGKGLHPDKVKETLAYCKKLWHRKILTSSGFIVGLPGETEQSINDTLEYLLSDDRPLDVFNFAPLFIREHNTDEQLGLAKSKLEKDPAKFGYEFNDDALKNSRMSAWETPNMSYYKAQEITRRIHTDPRVNKKMIVRSATTLGRITSLGYTVDDIFKIIYDTPDDQFQQVREEIFRRETERKEMYFNRLINY